MSESFLKSKTTEMIQIFETNHKKIENEHDLTNEQIKNYEENIHKLCKEKLELRDMYMECKDTLEQSHIDRFFIR